jgi:hypothetical protein
MRTIKEDSYMVTVVGWMVLETIIWAEGGVEKKEQISNHASE